MASTSETGHHKNQANFKTLLSHVSGYGSKYNPANSRLTLPAITTMEADSKVMLKQVKDLAATYKTSVKARVAAFKVLGPYATRLLGALKSSEHEEGALEDAATIMAKIRGERISAPKVTAPPAGQAATEATDPVSVSQRSFDSMIDHFDKFHSLLTKQPNYTPNEADLTVQHLANVLLNLTTQNTAVINAGIDWQTANDNRDILFYTPKTGLVDTAFLVKAYVKSVYGVASPEYKRINKVSFRNMMPE